MFNSQSDVPIDIYIIYIYTAKDSFDFAKEVCDVDFGECVLASFDVKSLFTNIPLKETINICTDYLFMNKENISNLSKKQFHKIIVISCY